jgi:uncharacterized protein YbjT (DUF2867 family)
VIVLVFGATGTAGGSVLRVCLADRRVSQTRALTRRPLDICHAKLRATLHSDFASYEPVAAEFDGIDACLFCLGVSVSQVSGEAEYRRITYDTALAAGRTMKSRSPAACFHFISGRSTALDSRFMWARVKAETERDLRASVGAVCWRPGFIDGADSPNAPRLYQVMRPMARLLSPFKSLYVRGEDIGRAMLQATREGLRDAVLENADIRAIAARTPR